MKTLVWMAALASLSTAMPAQAGEPVVIDRDATRDQLRVMREQLRQLREAARLGQPPPWDLLRLLDLEAGELDRQLSVAVPAGVIGNIPPPPRLPPPPPPVIDEGTFQGLLGAINAESFSSGKQRVIGEAAQRSFFLVSHVAQVVNVLSFSNDKVRAVELLWPHVVDKQNAFHLYEAFTFENDKRRVRAIIERR